jgi:glycosyltransferase involved in cell wall biosynthesis
MLCGTPSVASDLPGVRQPPRMTGMGEVVAIGDTQALAEAILRIIQAPNKYSRPRRAIEEIFGLERTVLGYETLFGMYVAKQAREIQPVGARET